VRSFQQSPTRPTGSLNWFLLRNLGASRGHLCFLFSVVPVSTGRKRTRDQSHARGPVGDGTLGRDFWPLNADDSLIALAPRRRGTESPVVLHGQSSSQLSPGLQQIDDLGPGGRCQAVPVRDQRTQCLLLPAMFRPGTRLYVVTAFGTSACGDWDAGAIPAASTCYVVSYFIAVPYVHDGRGQVSRLLRFPA
jgi:hypothetical protein